MRKTRVPVLVVVMALALIAAACSDDSGADATLEPEGSGAEATAPRAEPTTVPEPSAPEPAVTEPAEPEPGPGFIDLPHWGGAISGTFDLQSQPADECDNSDPASTVCTYELSFDSVSTHLGRARDVSTGTTTTTPGGCDDGDGTRVVTEGEGTIVSQWGDELFFRTRLVSCDSQPGAIPSFWVVTGGTGRFENASGTMSAFSPAAEVGYASISSGTLRVRADLWEEILPPPPERTPEPDTQYLELEYFEGSLSYDQMVRNSGECDFSDPRLMVCDVETQGARRGVLIGNSTEVSTGTATGPVPESCELADGTTVPTETHTQGTVTTDVGDTFDFVSLRRTDPCATAGTGSSDTIVNWRVTGGTGRFEDARGLMSGVTTPELEFLSISIGTLEVRADLWPEFAAEFAAAPAVSGETLHLRYWEAFLSEGLTFTRATGADCEITSEGVEECASEFAGNLVGTHIGLASETQSGTISTHLGEPCPGEPGGGDRARRSAAGTIITGRGDELAFHVVTDACRPGYWVLDGGTGRFEDAFGVMSGMGGTDIGVAQLNVGTFRLRADLWADLIPPAD